MIVQQVNLYQDSLKQKQLNSHVYFYISAIVVCLIMFMGFNLYWLRELHNKQAQVERVLANLNTKKAELKLLESKVPKQEINTALIAEVGQWQKKVSELTQTIEILTGNNSVQERGFSAYFQALASQSIPEVWLTVIYFDAQQQLITFEGSTFKTDKIPEFLQQLQKDAVFRGHSFARLAVEKAEQDPSLMNFKLSTHLEPLKKSHVE